MAVYWEEQIKDRLIIDDEAKHCNGLLVFDINHDGRISIFQDSDLQVTRDKFEAIDESVELTIDETINDLKRVIGELEKYKEWEHAN